MLSVSRCTSTDTRLTTSPTALDFLELLDRARTWEGRADEDLSWREAGVVSGQGCLWRQGDPGRKGGARREGGRPTAWTEQECSLLQAGVCALLPLLAEAGFFTI